MSGVTRCKDCKFWGVVGTFTLPGGSVHEFSKPLFVTIKNARQCLKLEAELDQDGEPCAGNAHLGTPPYFGCVFGERK